MSRNIMSRVVKTLVTLLVITLPASFGGIYAAASATDPWNPNALVVTNDAAGLSQDWFSVAADGQSWFSFEADGDPFINPDEKIYTQPSLNVTIYAFRYTGETAAISLTFTNAGGTRLPNTVTLHTDQMVCGKLAAQATWLPVTWHDTYDGSGLTSDTPGVFFRADDEVELVYLQVANNGTATSPHIRPDGSSIRLDQYDRSWVGLRPGWYTAIPYRLADDRSGYLYEPAQAQQRLWVPPCGGALAPAGQVPPGGTLPTPGTGSSGPGTGTATGKLTLLRKQAKVKATAINRKVASRTTFKLKRPGVRRAMVILAPAGEIVVKRVKSLRPGKYVLKARLKIGGQFRYKPVATLTVRR